MYATMRRLLAVLREIFRRRESVYGDEHCSCRIISSRKFLAQALRWRKRLDLPAQKRKIDYAADVFVFCVNVDPGKKFVLALYDVEHETWKWLILLVSQADAVRQHIGHGVAEQTAAKATTQKQFAG